MVSNFYLRFLDRVLIAAERLFPEGVVTAGSQGQNTKTERGERYMYKVNETMTGYDLAELLQGESGIFEGISPTGERFHIVSRAGHSISNLRLQPDKKNENPRWRVRKVGELRTEQQTA